ncbi:UDP-glycosyltransferase 90A1 [Elaeis guineensis]|uniref:Glycosyltransferase n=1 Tax=Elaeis guineensis var. tenera TaxID=51953 RepID=A0A6I9QR79_ELAGV|nr:UDP-glycosyltransferase 90A1 [Elaeis guineensis]
MGSSPLPLPHIAVFPFMSKGHTIPLIHLAHLLHRRRLATLTFFTTPLNAPFIRDSLAGTDASIVELPFPENVPDIPAGVESTDRLPSMSLFIPFTYAVKRLRPHFERALASLPTVSLLISDGFLGWTNDSASKFGIPRLVFYGMGNFAQTVSCKVAVYKPHAGVTSYDEPFMVPGFPHIWLTRSDLEPPFDDPNPDPKDPHFQFIVEQTMATGASQGVLVNSFYELEAAYVDRCNTEGVPRAWCIGPLCLARQTSPPAEKTGWMDWLDSRQRMNRPVIYVAFGSQAELSAAQLQQLAIGLERSGLDFLWVVRAKAMDLGQGFEERVMDRGRVVRGWVNQMEILHHGSVQGFISHCGWNSVMESVSAGVPILAWPLMAEQKLNAKFVVDELKLGLRVRPSGGTPNGLVMSEEIERSARELLVGEKGKEAAGRARNWAEAARKAMDGGASWLTLEKMIEEVCVKRTTENAIVSAALVTAA